MPSGAETGTRLDGLLTAVARGLLVLALGMSGFGLAWGLLDDGPDLPPATPVALDVPELGISADVVPIQLSAEAVLDPPNDPNIVGWWDGSAKPGAESGRTVITGHTVHTGGGALDPLVDLDHGRIVLRTDDGPRYYEVVDRSVVSYEDVAERARQIFGQDVSEDDGAPLILVTCTDFDGVRYASNVIITARPVDAPVTPKRDQA